MKFSTILNFCCVLVVMFFATTLSAQQKGLDDAAPGYEVPTAPSFMPEDSFDVQFVYPAQSLMTGATWCPVDTSIWVTYWQNDSVYRYSADGAFIEQFQVPVGGSRSVTYDGTNMWFGNATTTITAVDPVTKAFVTSVAVPEAARYLTYDPDANMGAGGFWLGNWSTDVYQVDMSGNTLTTIPTANLPASRYGAVYDNVSPNGPHVWFFHQSSATTSAEAVKYNVAGGYISTVIDYNASIGAAATNLAGGMFITDQINGQYTLGGALQNAGLVGLNLLDETLLTFSVDMNDYAGTFTQMYVSGNFNSWSGNANPMSDADGDGVWDAVISVPSNIDSIEWKYTYDDWTGQENFAGGEPCTKTTGAFTNRFALTGSNTTFATNCYNSCDACPVDITFRVNMLPYTGTYTNVYVSGNFNGWSGDANQMTDADGDGIYEVTLPLIPGDIEWKFTLDNWTDQEQFTTGDPCTITDPSGQFVNRSYTVDGAATLPAYCWNTCTDMCAVDYNVTFNVNMDAAPQEIQDSLAAGGSVYVSGNFNGWAGGDNPMTDNGDGTWTATIPISVIDTNHLEWKFQVNQWQFDEQFTSGDACTITDPSGQFVNRYYPVTGDVTFDTYCWSACTICLSNTNNITEDKNLFKLNPSLVRDFTNITFSDDVINQDKQVFVYNTVGQLVHNITVNNQAIYRLETSNFANGLYFVTVKTETSMLTQKFVVNK